MNSFNLNSVNQVNLNTGGNAVMLTAGSGNILNVNGSPVGGTTNTISGTDTFMTASGFGSGSFNVSAISASGGLGGQVSISASPGDVGANSGQVSITANGGSAPAGLFGQVSIIANQGVSDPGTGPITTGGYVNIQANSGGITSPTLTSRIDLNAGGLNLYAGIASPITSVEGYAFINGAGGVSLVAGTWTSAFQEPGTVYLYGLTGVVVGSDLYATDIYPYWNGLAPPANLSLNGRTTLSGTAYVDINNANTISFDAGGSGALSGVQTINGSAYPPASGGVASLNSIAGAVSLTATQATVIISPGAPTATDINLYVPSAPYTLSGTTAGAVIVNRPIGAGNPFTQNVFTNASQITFNIPPGYIPTDSVSYDGYAFFDFQANFNSFWGISYITNTFATPTDILGSTSITANALTYSNIQQIYIPINIIIPPTHLTAGGTITLTFFCNPTSINHYITSTPTNTAKIAVVRD
jgi:hypothetical protein